MSMSAFDPQKQAAEIVVIGMPMLWLSRCVTSSPLR